MKKPNITAIRAMADGEKHRPELETAEEYQAVKQKIERMNMSGDLLAQGNEALKALGIDGIESMSDVERELNRLEFVERLTVQDKLLYDNLAEIDMKYGAIRRLQADSNRFFGVEFDPEEIMSDDKLTCIVRKLAGKVVAYSGTIASVAWLEPTGFGNQKQWVFRPYRSMKELMANKKVKVHSGFDSAGKSKTAEVGLFDKWWNHPERDTATGTVFRPDRPPYRTRDGKLNLWSGFRYTPTYGNKHLPILDFALKHICNDRQDVFEHLMNYCAHMVQMPWDKPWTCWVIASEEQGTGKSLFVGGFLGKLFGQHAMTFKSSAEMNARFNSHLRPLILLYHDESLFSGNRDLSDKMKSNISDDRMSFEMKGIDKTGSEQVYHRHFISTNAVHAVVVEDSDRRYNVISPVMIPGRDKAWMAKFADDNLKNPDVMSDWLGYLLTRDINTPSIKNPINTEEKMVQKSLSLTGPQRFMRDLTGILTGDISFRDVNAVETFIERTKELTRVNREAVMNLYPSYQAQFRIHMAETLSEKGWSKELRKWASELAGPEFINDLNLGRTGYEPRKVNGVFVYDVAMFVERERTRFDD